MFALGADLHITAPTRVTGRNGLATSLIVLSLEAIKRADRSPSVVFVQIRPVSTAGYLFFSMCVRTAVPNDEYGALWCVLRITAPTFAMSRTGLATETVLC